MNTILNTNFKYSIKIALCTVLVSPILIRYINGVSIQAMLDRGLLFLQAVGLAISIPYVLIFWLGVSMVNKKSFKSLQKKIIIATINVIGIFVLFGILWQELFWLDIEIFLSYILISTVCIFSFKLGKYGVRDVTKNISKK